MGISGILNSIPVIYFVEERIDHAATGGGELGGANWGCISTSSG